MHSFRIFVILAFVVFSSALPIDVATDDVDTTTVSNVAKIPSENAIVAGAPVSGLSGRDQVVQVDHSNSVIQFDDSVNIALNRVDAADTMTDNTSHGDISIRSSAPNHSRRGIGIENVIQDIGGASVGCNINNVNTVKSDILNTIVGHGKDLEGLSARSLVAGVVDIGLSGQPGLNRRGNSVGSGDQGGQVADQSVNFILDAAGDSLFSGHGNTLSSVTNNLGSAAKDILIRDISADGDVDVNTDMQPKRRPFIGYGVQVNTGKSGI